MTETRLSNIRVLPGLVGEEVGDEAELLVDVGGVGGRRNVALGVVQLKVPPEEFGAQELLDLKMNRSCLNYP